MDTQNQATALSPGHPLNGERVLRIPRSSSDVLKIHKEKRIGTWNVQSMYQPGKAANIVKEMKRLQIDILGCSETRWPDSGHCIVDEYHIYFSGDSTTRNKNGVAMILNNQTNATVKGFIPISDRVALIKIKAKPFDLNIIQSYAPTSESNEQEIENFYEQLRAALKHTKKEEINIIMGDMNAKIGQGKVEDVVGDFGLGVRNERGERLIEFCQEMDITIMNTFFKLPLRRLYTWRSPADNNHRIVRNQIDFVMINRKYRNAITSCKTYPGADIPSDHNLLLARTKLRLKKIVRKKTSKNVDTRKLKQDNVFQQTKERLNKEFMNISVNNNHETEIEDLWNKIKVSITSVTEEELRPDKIEKRQQWMTDSILELMEERRQHRNRDSGKYKELHRRVLRAIREAKERWLQEKCIEIEILQQKHDNFNLYKKIKEATGKHQRRSPGIILDSDDNIIIETDKKLTRWKEYMEELFGDGNNENTDNVPTVVDEEGPTITQDEVESAIKRLKNNKAPGPDQIHGEVLKLLDREQMKLLTNLFNKVYTSGQLPNDWLLSTFIPIPKKTNASKCSDHRIISLMSHVLKAFLNILQARVFRRLDERISNTQFGFRKGLGTREALFSIQVLIQRARDVNADVFMCFIDFEKAFDKVQHDKLISILRESGIDDRDANIISKLYSQQKAIVRVENETSEEFSIKRGVRQGCILSPLLFNVYSEQLFKEALSNIEDGVVINGEIINNLRYADDTVIIADTAEGLQKLIDRVGTACNKYGMKINCKKTHTLIVSKNAIGNGNLQFTANNVALTMAETVTYLGCTLNSDWDHSREIKGRIEKARGTFNKMRNVLCNLSLNIHTRIRILKCYVLSTLLYGAEAWTLTDASCKRIDVFEMWCYRRMLRISWIHHVSNDTVLQRINGQLQYLQYVKRRKLEYFGHIMRNEKYHLLQLILQGKIEGRRSAGRRRLSWLRNLRTWTGMSSAALFRAAVNKVIWTNVIADIHRG